MTPRASDHLVGKAPHLVAAFTLSASSKVNLRLICAAVPLSVVSFYSYQYGVVRVPVLYWLND